MPFIKLDHRIDNTYFVNRPKSFIQEINLNKYLEETFEFAFNMTFGREGHHREHRSGGQIIRKNGEKFINAFQGKLAEFGTYEKLSSLGVTVDKPDLGIWGEGVWDTCDFNINGKKISIKSAVFFSSLLLLEKDDWNMNGEYIPDLESGNGSYDYFLLCRIKPDGKKMMRENQLFYSDHVPKQVLKSILTRENWVMDIPGFISKADLKTIIQSEMILPQDSFLNGKTKMDASNYYVQTGDLRPLSDFAKNLKAELA